MTVLVANSALTTLSGVINNSQTSFNVTDGSVFPSISGGDHFYATISDGTNTEIVRVTARSGNSLTVTRAADNSTASGFAAGSSIEMRVNAGIIDDLLTDIQASVQPNTAVTFTTVNTGQGDYELYAMNQDVQTTDGVSFASVNTGQGANSLYAMNQNVRTTDTVTFASGSFSQAAGGDGNTLTIANTTVTDNGGIVQFEANRGGNTQVSQITGFAFDDTAKSRMDLKVHNGTSLNTALRISPDSEVIVGEGAGNPEGSLHVFQSDSGVSPSPAYNALFLENSGNCGITLASGNTNVGAIWFGDDGNNAIGGLRYDHSNDEISLYANNAKRLEISSAGDIGIGITPEAALGMDAPLFSSSSGGGIRFQNPSDTADSVIQAFRGSGDGSEIFIGINCQVDTTGAIVRFNTGEEASYVSPQRTGSIAFGTGNNSGNPSERMRIDSSGNVQFNSYGAGTLQTDGSGNITASSDKRLKFIGPEYEAGLQEVLRLKPVTYSWRAGTSMETRGIYAGFTAQNVAAAGIGHAVGTDSKGFMTLSDRPLIAALVNSVKELSERLEAVENDIIEA